ncbi:hypothetical protein E4U47_005545, partial [Claviceps purpurea]
MGKFYEVAAISPTQSIVFRSKTTRPNIQYRVIKIESAFKNLEDEENKKVCEIVQQWLRQSQEGKAVVYIGSVDRVKRIGEMLHCGTYYSGVDTAEGKKDRLKTWIQGERSQSQSYASAFDESTDIATTATTMTATTMTDTAMTDTVFSDVGSSKVLKGP